MRPLGMSGLSGVSGLSMNGVSGKREGRMGSLDRGGDNGLSSHPPLSPTRFRDMFTGRARGSSGYSTLTSVGGKGRD